MITWANKNLQTIVSDRLIQKQQVINNVTDGAKELENVVWKERSVFVNVYLCDLRWKIWHPGVYDLLTDACSNFLMTESFSCRLVWTKYLTHHDAVRNLAFTRKIEEYHICYILTNVLHLQEHNIVEYNVC